MSMLSIPPDDWVAIFTAVLSGSTLLLWNETRKAASAATEQIRLGREEFNATHRPRVRVRNIVLSHPQNDTSEDDDFKPGELITGQFYLSNIGDSPAIIKEILCLVFVAEWGRLPMKRPYEGQNGISLSNAKLAPGSSMPWVFQSDTIFTKRQAEALQHPSEAMRAFVLGWIAYEDTTQTIRRTAFCRMYQPQSGRFVMVVDTDYEHEE